MLTISISLSVVLELQSVNKARKKDNNQKRRNKMIIIHIIILYLGIIKSLQKLLLITELSKGSGYVSNLQKLCAF